MTDNRTIEERTEDAFLGLIIGDAAGRPFEGLTREHINAVFRDSLIYPDPLPALKNREERWVKPGLYSSITRYALLVGAASLTRGEPSENLDRLIAEAINRGTADPVIFSSGSASEQSYLTSLKERRQLPYTAPFVKAAAFALPLGAVDREFPVTPAMILRFTGRFTTDSASAAAVLLMKGTLSRALNQNSESTTLLSSLAVLDDLTTWAESKPEDIFNSGFNPDTLRLSLSFLSEIISGLKEADDPDEAEKLICGFVNARSSASKITRAVIDRPETLIPFVLYFSDKSTEFHNIDSSVTAIIKRGGKSSVTGALIGAMSGAIRGFSSSSLLAERLINKTRIFNLVNSIANARLKKEQINDFLRNENLLIRKENEELSAKLKGRKAETKKQKPENPDYDKINRHVVESWTKADKAKWKKSGHKSIKE